MRLLNLATWNILPNTLSRVHDIYTSYILEMGIFEKIGFGFDKIKVRFEFGLVLKNEGSGSVRARVRVGLG